MAKAKEMQAKAMEQAGVTMEQQAELMEALIESTELTRGTVHTELAGALSDKVETLNFISSFTRVDSGFEEKTAKDATTGLETKYSVLTLPSGEKRNIVVPEHKSIIEQAIAVSAIEKGASIAKYAMVWRVEQAQAWKSVAGCKSIGDFAKEVLGIEKGTATDYLDTLRTFYTMDANGNITINNPLFEAVSLSNLKELKATYKSDYARLVKAITDGEVHLNLSQAKLRKEVKALGKELPNDTKQDDTKQDDTKQDNTKQDDTKQDDTKQDDTRQDDTKQEEPSKDPKTEATRYNDLAMGYALEVCKGDAEKCTKLADLYTQIANLLAEC